MKTKSINLFEFDELSEDIKAKVLENERDINVEDSFWHKYLLEEWEDKLKELGFEYPKISFSGFGSQGDGASFTSKHVDVEKFITSQKAKGQFKNVLKAMKDGGSFELAASVERIDHHYSHEYTVKADLEVYQYLVNDKMYERVQPEIGALESLLTETVRKFSKQIYRDLESEYEGLTSDEAVIDTIKANEYTFRSNGKMENE